MSVRVTSVKLRQVPTYLTAKRAADLVLATLLLLLALPLCLLLALLIYLDSPGPVLFLQRRLGLGGKPFTLYKFRTMVVGAPNLSTEEMQRLGTCYDTRVGRWIRRTSLDELPQLWNVLRGDMSLVGPRPALLSQTDLNALREKFGLHALRPGITGWAQVNGRDELDLQTKVALDLEYGLRMGPWMDLRILLLTVLAVFTARGNR